MATNSFGARSTLTVDGKSYTIYKLDALEKHGFSLARMPYSIKVMIENVLRREDGVIVTTGQIEALARWNGKGGEREVSFMPARVLLAGFHRSAGGRGPGCHARCDQEARRQSRQGKAAAAGRFGDRSFGAGRFVRHRQRVRGQRATGIRAQPGTLSFPAMGAGRVRQFPRRAARHWNRSPGESRISRAGGLLVGKR